MIVTLDKLPEAAQWICAQISRNNDTLVALYGEMGVGKTTLIKAICSELQVVDTVTSPTFALVNEYRTRAGQSICHFDLYRIDDIAEVYDLGYEEYFYSGSLCLIEWPEIIEKLLPDKVLRLQIRVLNDGRREITIIEK